MNKKLPVLLLLSFVLLSSLSHLYPYFSVDIVVSHLLQGVSQKWFGDLMVMISWPGDYKNMPALIFAAIISLLYLRLKTGALVGLSATMSSFFANGLLKVMINRPRPSGELVHVYEHLTDKSYPSGHTMTYTVIFGFLIFLVLRHYPPSLKRNLLVALLFLPLVTIGFSRIYLGAHWASDVLGGYLLGSLWLFASVHYYNRYHV